MKTLTVSGTFPLVNSEDGKYVLRSVKDRSPIREINAHQLMDVIAMSAWKSAEPGLIFLDQINKYNVFAKARAGPIRATNPCGEQSLYPYESCNLGSIISPGSALVHADIAITSMRRTKSIPVRILQSRIDKPCKFGKAYRRWSIRI